MKAAVITSPASLETMRVIDLPDPGQPGPGEVRVRVHATSLNYHELGLALGKLPLAGARRILFADASGLVEAAGPGVKGLKAADHVISRFFPTWDDGEPPVADFSTSPGDGVDGYGQEVVIRPASWFVQAPVGLSHAEAATLPVAGVTAWRALVVEGKLKASDIVLVLGTGGVSIAALQLAKAIGARVVATSSSDEKLRKLQQLGADEIINYRTVENWGNAVWEWTGGRGVDHVVEVGGPETLSQSIEAVRLGGHISMIGILTGFEGKVPVAAVTMKQAQLKGIVVGSRAHQQDLVKAVERFGLRPVIDRSFPLDQLADAYRYQASGRHFGKVCVEF